MTSEPNIKLMLWLLHLTRLLRNHADINKCNNWNTSPLIRASLYGHIDVVKCLLSSGAYVNLSDVSGQPPLFIASMEGHCGKQW
jgi:ankyrin repeat protein